MASGWSASAFGFALRMMHGSRRVAGRLEGIEIAKVEPLVAERRTEAESGKMVRHFFLPFKPLAACAGASFHCVPLDFRLASYRLIPMLWKGLERALCKRTLRQTQRRTWVRSVVSRLRQRLQLRPQKPTFAH